MTVWIQTLPFGTLNRVAKFVGINSIGDSSITDSGSLVTVANPLTVNGNATLGNSTSNTHTINGFTTITSAGGSPALTISSVTLLDATASWGTTFDDASAGICKLKDSVTGSQGVGAGIGLYGKVSGVDIAGGLIKAMKVTALTDTQFDLVLGCRAAAAGNVSEVLRLNTGTSTFSTALTVAGTVILNNTSGSTTIKGNTAIGDATTDTHTISGLVTQTVTGNGLVTTSTPVAGTTDISAVVKGLAQGTLDATAATRNSIALYGASTTTRSAGVNDVVNVGVFADASGGTITYAIYSDRGDVRLNATSGKTDCRRQLTVVGIANAFSVDVTHNQAAQTATNGALQLANAGTVDTTAGALTTYGVNISVTATRSAGANNLTNKAISATASGAQVNISLQTEDGDVVLNNTSGTTTIKGNTTLGTGSTSTHTLNGNITFSAAPTAGLIKLGSVQTRIFLAQQIFTTTGTFTYTPTTGTRAVDVEMIGGGGGSGGAGGGANLAVGGGGASGVYWRKWIDPGALVTSAVNGSQVGTGGAAGANTGGNGGGAAAANDTKIEINGTTYTAKGGGGGAGEASTAGQSGVAGGTVTAGSSAGDVVFGQPGGNGWIIANQWVISGDGGSTPLGAGGIAGPALAARAGVAGTGYGSGAAGAAANAANQAGAAGQPGVIIVREYA